MKKIYLIKTDYLLFGWEREIGQKRGIEFVYDYKEIMRDDSPINKLQFLNAFSVKHEEIGEFTVKSLNEKVLEDLIR